MPLENFKMQLTATGIEVGLIGWFKCGQFDKCEHFLAVSCKFIFQRLTK